MMLTMIAALRFTILRIDKVYSIVHIQYTITLELFLAKQVLYIYFPTIWLFLMLPLVL